MKNSYPLSAVRFQLRKRKGFALVMALYITAIVFSLATFFIADQIHKNRGGYAYTLSEQALLGANSGLNFILNYLGNLNTHWYDSVVLKDDSRNPICGTGPDPVTVFAEEKMTIEPASAATDPPGVFFATVSPGIGENDYIITKTGLNPTSSGDHVNFKAMLRIYYYTNRVPAAESCTSLGAQNPNAISHITVGVTANFVNAGETMLYATRQIRWTGRRTLSLGALYQCWTCFDGPSSKYPNHSEGTDANSFLGNGFSASSPLFGFAPPSSVITTDHSNNPLQSPYGSGFDGSMQVTAINGTGVLPDDPKMTNMMAVYNQVNQTIKGGGAGPSMPPKMAQGHNSGTPPALALPSGRAWGGINEAAAPAWLYNAYQQAASDSSCSDSGNVRTVFVTSSKDVGAGINADGTASTVGHDVEYDASGGHQKPGYAVTDISFDGGVLSIMKVGYYSGAVMFTESIPLADPKYRPANGILYVHGGLTRVHGNLTKWGITVAADQGENFFVHNADGSYRDVTPSDATNPCLARNPSIGAVAANSAERFSSVLAGQDSRGSDYWIPGSALPPSCSDINNCYPVVKGNPSYPGCTDCLYDGGYYDGGGKLSGLHVDDVNGQVNAMQIAQDPVSGNWQTSNPAAFSATIFAQPPRYNSDGTFAGNTILSPTVVQLVDSSGSVVASKMTWPYPGASALNEFQRDPSQADLPYLRQFSNSEGNMTISGDTTFEGEGVSLGLLARNYLVLNDFVSSSKAGVGDYTMQIRANLASTNHSMEWEGVLQGDPTFAQDTFVNGDYAAMNGTVTVRGTTVNLGYTFVDQTGTAHYHVLPTSGQGAPLSSAPSPLMSQPSGSFWKLKFSGSISAPYGDVVNAVFSDSGGSLKDVGYAAEQLASDRSVGTPPAGFPTWSFAQWQSLGMIAFYPTISYKDLGALQP